MNSSIEPSDILLNYVKRVLNITQIYHLNIKQQISIERLMQIIHLLPDLITLKINSLSFYRSITFSNQLFLTEHAKKIKYVYMETIHTIKDIYFLISFCPHMEYFNVECIEYINIQSFLRDILNEINQNHHQYLLLLCIYI
ncbi:unnamed protein product [Didymodactylos carnosus]|uniref:Uncharacterized protein n=1 Tax=Didymodactylos carnosus TaxID=1234261 RepID=A0A816E6R1_9BILA|nr:unnamed protein product [Didymodactylos carnosus]CAF4557164.1 unnamed protein product [Didymodactylos carnosus]